MCGKGFFRSQQAKNHKSTSKMNNSKLRDQTQNDDNRIHSSSLMITNSNGVVLTLTNINIMKTSVI